MNVLELFAGSCSFSKVAKERGHNVFTTDINEKLPNIDYHCDILDFDPINVPFIPDVIWASPDCSTWSKASGNLHYDKGSLIPKTEKAILAMEHVNKMWGVICHFQKLNSSLLYYIENPVGRLKMYIAESKLTVPRIYTLDQCQYGREFKKPTNIFTNDYGLIQKRCPGNCGHKPNLKNAGSGKRGNNLPNGYYVRAMIAPKLCEEILISAEYQYKKHL
jgi:hypothetical protein